MDVPKNSGVNGKMHENAIVIEWNRLLEHLGCMKIKRANLDSVHANAQYP